MMQDTPSSEGDIIEYNEALEKGKEVLSSPLYEDSKFPFCLGFTLWSNAHSAKS